MLGTFSDVFGDGRGDNFVVGNEDNVGASEAVTLEEELGGVLVVDDDVEESASGNGFQWLDEAVVVNGEKLEDSSLDLLSVEVGLGVSVLRD